VLWKAGRNNMKFSIIYSFDISKEQSVEDFHPPHRRKLWDITEDQPEDDDSKHRKLIAVLDRKQFEEFIDHVCIHYEEIDTMGSIGAVGPWPFYHLVPAFSFHDYDRGCYIGAYVTPYPDFLEKEGRPCSEEIHIWSEANWNRMKRAMKELY